MSRFPVNEPYTITTGFGVPDANALFGKHSGLDAAGFGAGRPIYAPTSGELTNVVSPTGGNMVVIFDGQYYHRLMHNSSFSRGNGHVEEGNEVARAGTTGLSTGVHCHWDINNHGVTATSFSQFINPNEWLKGTDMTDAQIMEEFNKRDKRMDAAEANTARLYETVDADVKNLERLYVSTDAINKRVAELEKHPPGGTVDGNYHIGPPK